MGANSIWQHTSCGWQAYFLYRLDRLSSLQHSLFLLQDIPGSDSFEVSLSKLSLDLSEFFAFFPAPFIMPGFWKRPVTRMYSYNLDLGEHYYYPISHYLEAERGTRGETPGALTFNERLARRWLHGRRYGATDLSDRYSRASSLSRFDGDWSYLAGEMSNRSARARSEIRTSSAGFDANNVSAFANYKNALLDTSRELRQEASANLLAREQSRSNSLANMRAEAAQRRSAFQQMRASTPMTATANAGSSSSSTSRSSYRMESK